MNDTVAAFEVRNSNGLNVFNNIFANYGTGYALKFRNTVGGPDEFLDANNNLLFTRGDTLARWRDSLCVDLAQLGQQDQGNSPFNVGRSPKGLGEFDPSFRSNFDLHVNNTMLDGAASVYDVITTDIDGQGRNPSTPDVGCDEYIPSFDAQMNAIISPVNGLEFQDSVRVIVQVKNQGSDINQLKVKYTFDGVIVDSTVKIFSPALKKDSVSFITFPKKFSTRQGGPHVVCTYTEIKKLTTGGQFVNDDFNTANDTLCHTVISLDTSDIGVSKFLQPLNGLAIKEKTPVSVQVTNYGNLTAYSYKLELKVNNKVKERKTINLPLNKCESTDISFNYQLDPDSAVTFEICTRTILSDDVIEANDSNCIVSPTTGVEVENNAIGLLSVYPNPTTGMLHYNMNLKEQGELLVSIYDLSGRMLREDHLGMMQNGEQEVEVDYTDVAAGTYLYTIQIGGNKVNGRFVIIK